jgi:hypothetical protein
MVAGTLSLQALLKALVSGWQVRILNVLAKFGFKQFQSVSTFQVLHLTGFPLLNKYWEIS